MFQLFSGITKILINSVCMQGLFPQQQINVSTTNR